MKSRLTLALAIGAVCITAGLLLPNIQTDSMDLRAFFLAGGITVLVIVGLVVLIYFPVLRAVARLRAARPESDVWLAQKGQSLARKLADIAHLHPASVPNHLVLITNPRGLEFWRPVSAQLIARIDADKVGLVRIVNGYPRSRLVVEVHNADGELVEIDLIPSSGRSGILPARPEELEGIRAGIDESLGARRLRTQP